MNIRKNKIGVDRVWKDTRVDTSGVALRERASKQSQANRYAGNGNVLLSSRWERGFGRFAVPAVATTNVSVSTAA